MSLESFIGDHFGHKVGREVGEIVGRYPHHLKNNFKEIVDLYCKYVSILKSKNIENSKNILAELGKVITTGEFLKHL